MAALPNLGRRKRTTLRRVMAFVAQRRNLWFVLQRPADVVNAHLWEFPSLEVPLLHPNPRRAARRLLGIAPATLERLCTLKHSITRYRITMDVFRLGSDCDFKNKHPKGRWLSPKQLDKLPFAAAHKKILQRLEVQNRECERDKRVACATNVPPLSDLPGGSS